MSAETQTGTVSKASLWGGRILSGLVTLALLASGAMKFIPPDENSMKELERIGWSSELVKTLGVVEIVCAILYIVPQTSVLGAILVTGYFGGAIATHVRIGDPFVVQAIIGVLAWLGLFLRDPRIRALIPWNDF